MKKGELKLKYGTKDAMIFALKKSRGIVTEASKAARVSRNTHYRWVNEDPEYAKAVDEANEMALDFVEGKLFELINGVKAISNDGGVYEVLPDKSCIIFYLKTKGKSRGYIERQEMMNGEVVIEIEGRTVNMDKREG